MRIIQVHTRYRQPGGEDVVVAREAELLRHRGHEVVEHRAENPGGAAAAAALCLSPWNPFAARSVERLARDLRPDVAHVHNTWYAMSPAVIRSLRRAGVPVVMTLHNYRLLCANAFLLRNGAPCDLCVGSHPWHGVRHRCYRGSALASVPPAATIALHRSLGTWARDVTLFFAITEPARESFIRGGLPAERLRVKPNFVEDPGVRLLPAARSRTVLYVGRLSPEKGVDVLLEAWERLNDSSLELVILGDGPERARLEARSPAGVLFEGHLPASEVRRRMLSARTLVLPSVWHEAADPLVVLEALSAGLPVLSSAVGGLPRLLGASGEGWLASPGSAAAWADSLRGLLDGGRVERASAWARALYQERFTPGWAADALEDAYAWARAHPSATRG